jgi:translocation and assembly module TamB
LLVTGALPVGLVNGFVSAPIDVQGTANFDLAIKGKPSLDAISGTVSTTDSRISVPAMRIALRKIEATAQLSGGRAALAVAGGFSSGGRVKVDGTLGLSQPFTADMKINLVNAEFTDAPAYTTTANGTLSIAGPLVGGASLAGKLELSNTEIRLAPTTSGRGIPEIRHLGESPAVAKTRERAGLVVSEDGKQDSGSSRPLNLDILIDAPNRIFIRGRGLDTELGGSLRITGTTAAVIPIGQFDLIRGRMDILGKRLEMQEGRLLIQGTLDPWFRMVAATNTSNANVRIITEGTPQSPTVTFESDPDLPDDEILANLLFGRDAASMSPLQAAQLAAAVATLAGNGGDGALGRLRQRLNLDDFDLTTDDNGAAALRFGKYLSDNVYSDVELGSEGRSQINLNLDITPSIVAKGRLDSDGETGLGVFFEKDY